MLVEAWGQDLIPLGAKVKRSECLRLDITRIFLLTTWASTACLLGVGYAKHVVPACLGGRFSYLPAPKKLHAHDMGYLASPIIEDFAASHFAKPGQPQPS
jgi:hypothetical protein